MKNAGFWDFRKKREERTAAAALVYDPVQALPPEVVATGFGEAAREIIAVAKAHGVPLIEDAGLAEALARIDVSERIPRELYAVVAEVLAYVYRIDEEFSADVKAASPKR